MQNIFSSVIFQQSSGSGSGSGIQTQKSTKSKSGDSDNNTRKNKEDDIGSVGLNAQDRSDNGSGTQVKLYTSL